jgi:cytochrome c-type biogenesis protein CcmE
MHTITKLGLTACVVVGGSGFLIYSSIGHASHYVAVDELVGDGFDRWLGKDLKIRGTVKPSSLVEAVIDQQTERSFVLQVNGREVRVFSRGPKPDTFTNDAEVIAQGRIVAASELQPRADALCKTHVRGCPIRADAEHVSVIDASDLSAKCPDHYDGARSNAKLGEPALR